MNYKARDISLGITLDVTLNTTSYLNTYFISLQELIALQKEMHQDFSKADALFHLLNKTDYNIQKKELIFNTIAYDKDEYEVPYINLTFEHYLVLKKKYKDNKLFNNLGYLHECIECSLSRLTNPILRNTLENIIIKQTINFFPDKQDKLIITDLASGNLFQLFIITNKLIAQGYSNLTLYIIDTSYALLYFKLYFKYNNYFILKENQNHWTQDEYNYLIQELYKAYKSTTNNSISFYLTQKFTDLIDEYLLNNIFFQFVRSLKNINKNITIKFYKSADDYIKDNNHDNALKSSLLLAIDHLLDLYPEVYITWNQLRKSILQKNGYAYSVAKKAGISQEEVYLSAGNNLCIEHYKWDFPLKIFKQE